MEYALAVGGGILLGYLTAPEPTSIMSAAGWNGFGQLCGGDLEFCEGWRRSERSVVHAAAGGLLYAGFTLVVDARGRAWHQGHALAFLESSAEPQEVPLGGRCVGVSAGTKHAAFVLEDGSVVALGDDSFGQCRVAGVREAVRAVSCGDVHTLLVTRAGRLYSCGSNSLMQLGSGGVDAEPVGFFRDKRVKCASAGESHSLVLLEDGSLYSSGSNVSGQLGRPEAPPVAGPGRVPGVFDAISAGGDHSLAVCDGRLFAWGEGFSAKPRPVDLAHRVLGCCAGGSHSLAITEGGLAVRGRNNECQLGLPLSSSEHSEWLISDENVKSNVSASQTHSLYH